MKNAKEYANSMASTIRQRTSNPVGRNSSYEGIECRIGNTWSEVRDYLLANFEADIQAYIDRGVTPSIDRKDPTGHYEDGNLRIIDYRTNTLMGAVKGTEAVQKPILVQYPDGRVERYESTNEAGRKLGYDRTSVWSYLKGHTWNSKGLIFMYEDEELRKVPKEKITRGIPLRATFGSDSWVFESIDEAARELGCKRDTINRALRNNVPVKIGRLKGYRFEQLETL